MTETCKLHIGAWIRHLGKKQCDIAKAAGIGKSYLSLLASTKRTTPSVEVLFAITLALGLTNPRDLLRLPTEKAPDDDPTQRRLTRIEACLERIERRLESTKRRWKKNTSAKLRR